MNKPAINNELKEMVPPKSDTLNVESIKKDFPILNEKVHGRRLVYLDNAASTQKPNVVIDAIVKFYRESNSNIHRGIHTLANKATESYENTRKHVARFIGGVNPEEIIFTRGTTEAINLVMYTWGDEFISEGDEIVITEMEHHANFVPWVILAKKKKAIIKKIPITFCGHLDLSNLDNIITDKTKLVAVSHMSNVLGTINPIKEIGETAHKKGAVVIVDGAQAAPHLRVDVKDLDIDFYTFSSHKMLGPTGVGVLYGKKDILESMPPFNLGGEMIRQVSFEKITWNEIPNKFEAGTPNIADVVAFDAALNYLELVGIDKIREHEKQITAYAIEKLLEIDGLEIQGPQEIDQRGGAVSFTDKDIHPHDIGTFLDSRGIAIRAGHHCAQPLMRVLGKIATARASFYIYNDESDVDALVETLKEMRRYFGL